MLGDDLPLSLWSSDFFLVPFSDGLTGVSSVVMPIFTFIAFVAPIRGAPDTDALGLQTSRFPFSVLVFAAWHAN